MMLQMWNSANVIWKAGEPCARVAAQQRYLITLTRTISFQQESGVMHLSWPFEVVHVFGDSLRKCKSPNGPHFCWVSCNIYWHLFTNFEFDIKIRTNKSFQRGNRIGFIFVEHLRCGLFNQYPCAHWVSSIILLKHKKLIHAAARVAGLLDQVLLFHGFQTCAVQLWWALIPAWNWVTVASVGRNCSLVAGRRGRGSFQGCDLDEASRLLKRSHVQKSPVVIHPLKNHVGSVHWVETLVTSSNPSQVDAT